MSGGKSSGKFLPKSRDPDAILRALTKRAEALENRIASIRAYRQQEAGREAGQEPGPLRHPLKKQRSGPKVVGVDIIVEKQERAQNDDDVVLCVATPMLQTVVPFDEDEAIPGKGHLTYMSRTSRTYSSTQQPLLMSRSSTALGASGSRTPNDVLQQQQQQQQLLSRSATAQLALRSRTSEEEQLMMSRSGGAAQLASRSRTTPNSAGSGAAQLVLSRLQTPIWPKQGETPQEEDEATKLRKRKCLLLEKRRRKREVEVGTAWMRTGTDLQPASAAARAAATLAELGKIYNISADETAQRAAAATRLTSRLRGVWVRARYRVLKEALRSRRTESSFFLATQLEGAVRWCEGGDESVARMARKRDLMRLQSTWRAIHRYCVVYSHNDDDRLAPISKEQRNEERKQGLVKVLLKGAQQRQLSAFVSWLAAARGLTRKEEAGLAVEWAKYHRELPTPEARHFANADAVAEYSLNNAGKAAKRAEFVANAALNAARVTRCVAEATHAAADARARTVFEAWARWAKLSGEGRFALVIATDAHHRHVEEAVPREEEDVAGPDDEAEEEVLLICESSPLLAPIIDVATMVPMALKRQRLREELSRGFRFARELNTPQRGQTFFLKPSFVAPYDVKRMASLSRSFRQRRCFGRWSGWAAKMTRATLMNRRRLTWEVRTMLLEWCFLAAKLQHGRREAERAFQTYRKALLSKPLGAWYVWVRSRIEARRDADRIVAAYLRIKRRNMIAAILRAWRHSAELTKLEARYTRKQLMAALWEQKGHIRRLERLADDHGLARIELEAAAFAAKNRAVKLARQSSTSEDECRLLEANLKKEEADLELAHFCFDAVRESRPAIADHIVREQPEMGFLDRGLAELVKERRDRRNSDVAVAAAKQKKQAGTSSDDIFGRFEAREGDQDQYDDEQEGHLVLSTLIPKREVNNRGKKKAETTDDLLPDGLESVCDPSFVAGMVLCRSGGAPPREDVRKQAFVARLSWVRSAALRGVLRFREVTEMDDAPLYRPRHLPAHAKFVPLNGVPHGKLETLVSDLQRGISDLYSIFEFLRIGDAIVLSEALRADWVAFCCSPNDKQHHRQWPSMTVKVPLRGRVATWTDLRTQLDAKIQMPRRSNLHGGFSKHLAGADKRRDDTYISLYAGKSTKRTERPNPYSKLPVIDTFKPPPNRPWQTEH